MRHSIGGGSEAVSSGGWVGCGAAVMGDPVFLKKLLHSLDRGTGIWYSPRTPEASPVLVEADETCGRGGIGRRAALRSLWANPRGSSSLLDRTIPSQGEDDTKKSAATTSTLRRFFYFGVLCSGHTARS